MTVGAMIAAGAARERSDVLQRFRLADATAPDRAQSLDSLGLRPEGMVAQLMASGVILQGPRANRVYLSEAALAAWQSRDMSRQRLVATASVVMALLLGLGAVFFAFSMQHRQPLP